MTPKEKAQELLNNFYQATDGHWNQVPVSKQCALIAVNEIFDIAYWQLYESGGEQEEKYWQEVKQEIVEL
jgi:hypothetical protein